MKGLTLWLAVTCTAYGLGGLWLGGQMRPSIERYQERIIQPVSQVAHLLGR